MFCVYIEFCSRAECVNDHSSPGNECKMDSDEVMPIRMNVTSKEHRIYLLTPYKATAAVVQIFAESDGLLFMYIHKILLLHINNTIAFRIFQNV